MASTVTVEGLFEAAGFKVADQIGWSEGSLPASPGIYVISVGDPAKVVLGQPKSGKATADQIDAARRRWRGEQTIVYIGKAKNLKKRINQFCSHKFGSRSPHAGGQAILLIQSPLSIFWVVVDDEAALPSAEHKFLSTFEASAGCKPFGNRMKAAQPKGAA